MTFEERPDYDFIESCLRDIINQEADKLAALGQHELVSMLKLRYGCPLQPDYHGVV
jgi:hypothetical protein